MSDEPPLLVSPALPPKTSSSLQFAVIGVGLLQLGLAMAVAEHGPHAGEAISYRIGMVIGATAIWPLIIMGLFAIGKQFRNPRTRKIILLVVWGITSFGHLGTLATARRSRPLHQRPPIAQTATNEFKFNEPQSLQTDGMTGRVWTSAGEALRHDPTAPPEPAKAHFDFSPGSNERLVKQIEHAQETAYHEVVSAYAAACAERPEDATLALERVKFIARFSSAEDVTIESAEADYTVAREHLVKYFPETPGTVLFLLEQIYGDKFSGDAERYAPLVSTWRPVDSAKYMLLRAQRALPANNAVGMHFAEISFQNNPTPEAGLLFAQSLVVAGKKKEASKVIHHEVFAGAAPWIRKEKMDVLFDLGETTEGVSVFKELLDAEPTMIENSVMAGKLADAGQIELARTVWAKIPSNEWSRAELADQRFQFELKFGNPAQANEAYRELRNAGLKSDPLARNRAALLRKYPSARWTLADVGGVLIFAILLGIFALLPLAVFLPVHYWSLLRERRGQREDWTISPWGLKTAWLVTGTGLVGILFSLWVYQPALLTAGFSGREAGNKPVLAGPALLGSQTIIWVVLSCLAVALLWRARAWRLLGSGAWEPGKSIGVGIGIAVGLKILLSIYLAIVPIGQPPLAEISPLTSNLMTTVLSTLGPWGMIAVMGLFVPVLEEILFRGVLLGAMARHIPFWTANILQSVGFALMHEELGLAPFFIGFAFLNGVLVQRSGGLLASISMHVFNNTLVCVLIMLLK